MNARRVFLRPLGLVDGFFDPRFATGPGDAIESSAGPASNGSESKTALADCESAPIISGYLNATCHGTQIRILVTAPDDGGPSGSSILAPCAPTNDNAGGCTACQRRHELFLATEGDSLVRRIDCATGLSTFVRPVVIGSRHVASLWSDWVLVRPQNEELLGGSGAMACEMLHAEGLCHPHGGNFGAPMVTTDRMKTLFDGLAASLARIAECVGPMAGTERSAAGTLAVRSFSESPLVARARQWLKEHFKEAIAPPDVARGLKVNQSYLCRQFKKATGTTLTHYIARARVAKAKELLDNPELRVIEIAMEVGFGSLPRFNAVFKQQAGMSPTQYRKASLSLR